MKVSAEVEIGGVPVTVTGDVVAEQLPQGRAYSVSLDLPWPGNEAWLEQELVDAYEDEQAIARWHADMGVVREDGKS